VSYAAIAMLVDGLDDRSRRRVALGACGGVKEITDRAPSATETRRDTRRRCEAEEEWWLSIATLRETALAIAERAEHLVADGCHVTN
jgi:hypothetical protein